MNLLLTFALSAVLVAPARPMVVEPDSGSVAFITATVWLRADSSFNSRHIALLPRGAQVRVIQCHNQACNVSFRRLQGYVVRELLRATPGPQPVDPGQGYINSKGEWIPSPAHTSDGVTPDGATARCRDGSYSFSQSRRGTCSWHGGVDEWLSQSSAGSGDPRLTPEAALALLMSEHRLSIALYMEADSYSSTNASPILVP